MLSGSVTKATVLSASLPQLLPQLPDEVVLQVLAQGDDATRVVTSQLNKQWYRCATDPQFGLHDRVLLRRAHAAYVRHGRGPYARVAVRTTLQRGTRDLGENQLLARAEDLFANAVWLEQRDRGFARCLFREARTVLRQAVPEFATALKVHASPLQGPEFAHLARSARPAPPAPAAELAALHRQSRRRTQRRPAPPEALARLACAVRLKVPLFGAKSGPAQLLQLTEQLGRSGQGAGLVDHLRGHALPEDPRVGALFLLQAPAAARSRHALLQQSPAARAVAAQLAELAAATRSLAGPQKLDLVPAALRFFAERLTSDQADRLVLLPVAEVAGLGSKLWQLGRF